MLLSLTLFIGVFILFIAILPYLVFFLGIHFGKKERPAPEPKEYPAISIIMAAYNEAVVIRERIFNIKESEYPIDKYEIVLVDDRSSDDTLKKAEVACREAGIKHTILENPERMGTNRSINRAIGAANHSVLVTTDADVFFEKHALKRLISRLMSEDRIAAVCGDLRPLPEEVTHTSRLENTYRDYYGRMCAWESAVDSTYNFNGGLVAFKKDLVHRIDDRRGADDANTAFEAIRRGYRAVYEIDAIVYEDIPENFTRQYKQKIRRATRLIEATIANFDLLKKDRPFSRLFYPLRISMYLLTPPLFFISCIFLLTGLLLINPLLPIGAIFAFIALSLIWKSNIITAFVTNQTYLTKGLLNLGKDMRIWESTSKK
ncbi:MAG: glycosyltransferase [Methanocalculus sp.]|uniref:glycosyltransferase n=1 Tax=Methanocalculus sp. TaxID=2004547 RepID=UPI00271D8C27|nr:glycosyltransferase [Methanocalculus sp.]MDO9538384.1 glycosyltransferase [Methanocalculus sp.]